MNMTVRYIIVLMVWAVMVSTVLSAVTTNPDIK